MTQTNTEQAPEFILAPIDQVEIYPTAEVRFEYTGIEELAQDIKENGQLQPGLAIYKDNKYYVYVGVRRLKAIQLLNTKNQTLNYYKLINTNATTQKILESIIAENRNRIDFTNLENLNVIELSLKNHIPLEHMQNTAIRYSNLIQKLPYETRRKLHMIEIRSNYTFKFKDLEEIASLMNEANVILLAAQVAFFKTSRDMAIIKYQAQIPEATPKWLYEIFPEMKPTPPPQQSETPRHNEPTKETHENTQELTQNQEPAQNQEPTQTHAQTKEPTQNQEPTQTHAQKEPTPEEPTTYNANTIAYNAYIIKCPNNHEIYFTPEMKFRTHAYQLTLKNNIITITPSDSLSEKITGELTLECTKCNAKIPIKYEINGENEYINNKKAQRVNIYTRGNTIEIRQGDKIIAQHPVETD